MHSNPALEPPHAHCFAPQASADLRLLAAFAPQASADPLLLAAFAPQASAVHLRRSALCSATPRRLHSRLQSRGARRATERATPYRTRWPPYPSPSIPDGGGLGGRSTTYSTSSAQRSVRTVRGLELEPPSLRPAPRPRADSRPIARSQVPGVTPARLPLNQRSSPMVGWCSGRSAVGLVVLSRWRWPWGGALRSGSPRALHSRAYRTTRWLSHSGRRWLLHGSQRA